MKSKIENLLQRASAANAAETSINSAKRQFTNETQAQVFYADAKSKLSDLAVWNEKTNGVDYELFDESGEICTDKLLKENRFIRLSLTLGGKFDWIKIIEINESDDEFVIMVQPSYNPTEKPVDKSVVSHFYASEARNNFCLQIEKTSVICRVIGLNEKQNTAETKNLPETIRNAAVANFGYFAGIQKGIWKDFCKKILED